jgi:UDP-N-acetylmuramate--alanine ligase
MTNIDAFPMFHKISRIHMIGIGGSGMSGIAEVLHALGFEVSGSDMNPSETTRKLQTLGIIISEGHKASNISDAHVVVFSSAVRPDNVEVVEAMARKIPVIERAEMLGELTRMKFTVGISGTHGKTTTTSLAGQILTAAGFQPTIIVGGIAQSLGSGGILGEGHHFVVEADEYQRTFLQMFPTIAVVTSIEADHLDCYRDLDDIRETFAAYLSRLPFFGVAIMCIDDPNVRDLAAAVQRSLVTYGLSKDADIRATNIELRGFSSSFELIAQGESIGRVEVPIPGEHNVRNTLAAIAVGRELGIPIEVASSGLASFSGVNRRFQIRGAHDGVTVVDDFAHHPTALRETLRTAKKAWGDGRVVVVFQPHLFSRTRDFQHEFAESLLGADVAFVADIYPSREKPMPGVTSELIVSHGQTLNHPDIRLSGSLDDTVAQLRSELRDGDLLMTVGAGDVNTVGDAILDTETPS